MGLSKRTRQHVGWPWKNGEGPCSGLWAPCWQDMIWSWGTLVSGHKAVKKRMWPGVSLRAEEGQRRTTSCTVQCPHPGKACSGREATGPSACPPVRLIVYLQTHKPERQELEGNDNQPIQSEAVGTGPKSILGWDFFVSSVLFEASCNSFLSTIPADLLK